MLIELVNHTHFQSIVQLLRRLTLLCLVCFSLGAAHFAWSGDGKDSGVSCSCEEKCDPFCDEDVIDDCFDEEEEPKDGGPPTGRPVAKGSVSATAEGGTATARYSVRLTSEGAQRIGSIRPGSVEFNHSVSGDSPVANLYVDGVIRDVTSIGWRLIRDVDGRGAHVDIRFRDVIPPGARTMEVRVEDVHGVRLESETHGTNHNLKPRKGSARSLRGPIE